MRLLYYPHTFLHRNIFLETQSFLTEEEKKQTRRITSDHKKFIVADVE